MEVFTRFSHIYHPGVLNRCSQQHIVTSRLCLCREKPSVKNIPRMESVWRTSNCPSPALRSPAVLFFQRPPPTLVIPNVTSVQYKFFLFSFWIIYRDIINWSWSYQQTHFLHYPYPKQNLSPDLFLQFSSAQSLSCVQLFATPWITARQASLSITNSQSSLKLMSIESMMPSSHLILCCPLLLLPPIPPSIGVFSNESTLLIFGIKSHRFNYLNRNL